MGNKFLKKLLQPWMSCNWLWRLRRDLVFEILSSNLKAFASLLLSWKKKSKTNGNRFKVIVNSYTFITNDHLKSPSCFQRWLTSEISQFLSFHCYHNSKFDKLIPHTKMCNGWKSKYICIKHQYQLNN